MRSSKLLNFVLSDEFDDCIINYIVEEKKETLKEYLSNKTIAWDHNDIRFTVHDMNRAKIQYLDMIINKMIEDAQLLSKSMLTDQDDKKYRNTYQKLQDKKNKIKDFL